jgi:hypothetical protein
LDHFIAVENVGQKRRRKEDLRKENVVGAINYLKQVNTEKEKPVLPRVEIVYDITVEKANCFYANGILVGNCDSALMALELSYNNMNLGDNFAEDKENVYNSGTVAGNLDKKKF